MGWAAAIWTGFLEAAALDQVEPAHRLLRLRKRAVRDQPFPAADAHRACAVRRGQLIACEPDAPRLEVVHPQGSPPRPPPGSRPDRAPSARSSARRPSTPAAGTSWSLLSSARSLTYRRRTSRVEIDISKSRASDPARLRRVRSRVVILGAGFGGLELTTILSEALGDGLDLTLIDERPLRLRLLEARRDVRPQDADAVRLAVQQHREAGRALSAGDDHRDRSRGAPRHDRRRHLRRRVLVVALGADYDVDATPGLAEGGNEFYSVAGAERLREVLPDVLERPRDRRRDLDAVQVPARAERGRAAAARLPHRARRARRLRDQPRDAVRRARSRRRPTPRRRCSRRSPSAASLRPKQLVRAIDPARRVAILDDGSEMPFDLFLGVPKHRVPDVVAASGMTEDGWIPVTRRPSRRGSPASTPSAT